MQLTINVKGENAKVVSYLLAKNPNNLYERNHKGHLVRFFYSQFNETEVEATIFVSPDSIELSNNSANAYDITHYINDREFAVSSIFCSFIRTALGTALNGQPKEEYLEWVGYRFPIEYSFGPVVSTFSNQEIRDLFEPLGYEVSITREEIDYSFQVKEQSSARYVSLKGNGTLQDGLRQLFILIPVIDNYKHYYIDEKEIEKLERYGQGWLDKHPQKDFIVRQSLRFKEVYSLVENKQVEKETKTIQENKMRLNDLRYEKIVDIVKKFEARERIVDFGSGEGKLSYRLGFMPGVKEVLAVEPSEFANLQAVERFNKGEREAGFVKPMPVWGSLFYYDERLKDKDIIILCEVIEHIDKERLPKIMETILDMYQPRLLMITTPNKEYNNVYGLDELFRHNDHRFEWTRKEFQAWCSERNDKDNYQLVYDGVGEEHTQYGFPTQMCMFVRKDV